MTHMKGIVFILAACIILPGCVDLPVKVTGYIKADRNINRNYRGRPAPLQLTIFHLKRSKRFRTASYNQLTKNQYAALNKDLIKTQTIIIRPNQRKSYNVNLRKDVRYIGVVAGYRRFRHKQWRSVFTVAANPTEKLGIRVTKKSVSIIRISK